MLGQAAHSEKHYVNVSAEILAAIVTRYIDIVHGQHKVNIVLQRKPRQSVASDVVLWCYRILTCYRDTLQTDTIYVQLVETLR